MTLSAVIATEGKNKTRVAYDVIVSNELGP